MEKYKKTFYCLVYLAHLEQKKFLKFFHLAIHRCHPLKPSTAATHRITATTAASHHGGWGQCQWWMLVVVGGSSRCQRWLAVVGGVGWQGWELVAAVVMGCDRRCEHRVLLDLVPSV